MNRMWCYYLLLCLSVFMTVSVQAFNQSQGPGERERLPQFLDQVKSIYATQEFPDASKLQRRNRQQENKEKERIPRHLHEVNSIYATQEIPEIHQQEDRSVAAAEVKDGPRDDSNKDLCPPEVEHSSPPARSARGPSVAR